jgi:hypothetical protein
MIKNKKYKNLKKTKGVVGHRIIGQGGVWPI